MKTIHGRTDFLSTQDATTFSELLSLPPFVTGIRTALLEFLTSEPRGTTWESAARSHDYSQGAKDFAQFLLTFTDAEPTKPKPATENLQWPTKQSLNKRHQVQAQK